MFSPLYYLHQHLNHFPAFSQVLFLPLHIFPPGHKPFSSIPQQVTIKTHTSIQNPSSSSPTLVSSQISSLLLFLISWTLLECLVQSSTCILTSILKHLLQNLCLCFFLPLTTYLQSLSPPLYIHYVTSSFSFVSEFFSVYKYSLIDRHNWDQNFH